MADKPTGLSCPLCLQADEPESMLTIHMTHGLAVREFDVTLCSQCVAAIVGAIENAASSAGLELSDQGAAPEDPEAESESAPASDGGRLYKCFEHGVYSCPNCPDPSELTKGA